MPTSNHHHLYLSHFSFDSSRELKLIYVVRIVRSLVNNLAFFFLPLFLYQLAPRINIGLFRGLSDFQMGMGLISLFYILSRGGGTLSIVPMSKVIAKIGYGRSLLLSQVFSILVLVLLKVSNAIPLVIFVVAIFDGFERNWFWSSYQTKMAKNSHKKNTGQDLGLIQFLINLMMMISPAIGGFVIKLFGYESLFLYTSLVLLVGMISSLKMKEEKTKNTPSFKEFFSWLREKSFVRLVVSFGGKYFHDAAIFVWPLYVFLILGAADKVGFLYTFSLFLAMILSFFIGYQIDNSKSKKPFFLSGAIMSALWFLRINIVSVWSIAISDMINRISQNYHGLFFDRKTFNRSRGSKVFSYFVYHELIMRVSAVFFWLLFGLFFVVFKMSWNGLFVLGAVGVMLSLLIKGHK